MGAGHLKIGDKLKQADGTLGEVRYVNTIQQARTMYNLEVEEAHTFFVGTQGWLVHNCPDGDDDFEKMLAGYLDDTDIAAKKVSDRLNGPKGGFNWNNSKGANVDHIARHGITPDEFEDAFLDPRRTPLSNVHPSPNGEQRFGYEGKTQGGRSYKCSLRNAPMDRSIQSRHM